MLRDVGWFHASFHTFGSHWSHQYGVPVPTTPMEEWKPWLRRGETSAPTFAGLHSPLSGPLAWLVWCDMVWHGVIPCLMWMHFWVIFANIIAASDISQVHWCFQGGWCVQTPCGCFKSGDLPRTSVSGQHTGDPRRRSCIYLPTSGGRVGTPSAVGSSDVHRHVVATECFDWFQKNRVSACL